MEGTGGEEALDRLDEATLGARVQVARDRRRAGLDRRRPPRTLGAEEVEHGTKALAARERDDRDLARSVRERQGGVRGAEVEADGAVAGHRVAVRG